MLTHTLHQAEASLNLGFFHAPVAPWLTMEAQGPRLSLWLKCDRWPEQLFLRAEPDNEEWLQHMHHEALPCGWRCYSALLPPAFCLE